MPTVGRTFDGELLDDDRLCESCDLVAYEKPFRDAEDAEDAALYAEGMKLWKKALAEADDIWVAEQWQKHKPMGVDQHGEPIQGVVKARNAGGLREALTTLGVDLRYNARAHRAELQHNGNEWQPLNDRLVAKLRGRARGVFRLHRPAWEGWERGGAQGFEVWARCLGRRAQRPTVRL